MDKPLHDSPQQPLNSNPPHFRIGTRGSDLALWQARFTQDRLEASGATVELIIISTQGDRIQNVTFDKMEGKGFFTKEIESALLDDRIDIAVHSHKDLETTSPHGLCIAAVPTRGPVEDVLIMQPSMRDDRTPLCVAHGAKVGTSSHRRRAQLQTLQSGLNIVPLRGNVPTRIGKLRQGEYDAIVLARAGIERLGLDLSDLHVQVLPPNQFVPAPAQGALAIQMRNDDDRLDWVRSNLNDEATLQSIDRERSVLRALEGGCLLPFGAHMMKNRLRTFLETPAGPRLSEIEIADDQTVADSTTVALARLSQPLHGTVFLTKSLGRWPVFEALAQAAGLQIIGQPLVRSEVLSSAWPERPVISDWLWLHSPSAAEAMLPLLSEFPGQIGCAGKGTAATLARVSDRIPQWVGTGTPEKTHAEFAAFLKTLDHRVFIPHSDRSLERWTSLSTPDRTISWCAYQTILEPAALPPHAVAVITSPSQWEAYAQSVSPVTPIVTLGNSTAAAVQSTDSSIPIEVSSEPSECEIWLAVERALHR